VRVVREPAAVLAGLIERQQTRISAAWAEEAFGSNLGMLRRSGVLQPAGVDETIECFQCDDAGHLVNVVWQPERSTFRGACPIAGDFEIEEVSDSLMVDRKSFFEALAGCFGIDAFMDIEGIPNALWYLGCGMLGSRKWSVLYCRGVEDAATGSLILQRLQSGIGHEAGLILCDHRPPFADATDLRHAFASVAEVLDLGPDGFIARAGGLRARLNRREPGAPRRPNQEISLQLFHGGQLAGLTATTLKKEAERVRKAWPQERATPSESAISKHIAAEFRAIRGRLQDSRFQNPA
jgi:hypothetical protein